MKKCLLLLLVILPLGLSAQVGVNLEDLLTTIVLKDVSDSIIAHKAIRIYTPERGVASEGTTDANGEYKVRLRRGMMYSIEFMEAGRDWAFNLKVTTDPAATYYRTTCKIDVAQGDPGTIVGGQKMCMLTIILMDSAAQRLKFQAVNVQDLSGASVGAFQTDEKGELILTLPRNFECMLLIPRGRKSFAISLTVPNIARASKEIQQGVTK